jgi:hypothetical protein
MNRKTYLGIILLIFLGSISMMAYAQDGEKIRSIRIAIYTEILHLSPQEAKVFWPVFEEYQKKLKDIQQQEKRERNQAVKNWNLLSDAEATLLLDKMLEYEQKEIDLKKQYIEEFKKVIPVKKVLLLRKAEMQFKKALLEKIKNAQTD